MNVAVTVDSPETESVFRPALVLMSGRTLAFAATFFIPIVLARIFAPAEFGTYKQLFLIQSTAYYIAQLGMATSLYYFLPRAPGDSGRYIANSICFLGGAGLVCCAVVVAAAPRIAHWMSNDELATYLPWIGLYLFLTMLATPLEIILISRSQYLWASASYAIFDFARAAAFILPVIFFRQLSGLLWGAVGVAFLRVVVMLFYVRKEFHATLRPDKRLLQSQLVYALPFSAAVLVETMQGSLPQYAVSYMFDPATFAVFAVGCLQIPLVDFAASPTSDVMMVKMQARLAEGKMRAVLSIWYDATWKLALLFFPLVAFCVVAAREIILLLFTSKYVASVPIFMAWSTVILFTVFQLDGVMRVFAQTWFLLAMNLVRLAIIGGLIRWSLTEFHLLGPVLVILLATLVSKALALARMKTLLRIRVSELLPWRSLALLLAAAAAAAVITLAVKAMIHAPNAIVLLTMGVVHSISYATLVWRYDLLNKDEQQAVSGWIRRVSVVIAQALAY